MIKKLKMWALLIAARFFGAFAMTAGWLLFIYGDPFTPIFLMIPGMISVTAPIGD